MMNRILKILTVLLVSSTMIIPALPAGAKEKPEYNATYGMEGPDISVATGSPGSLGLLEALALPFCKAHQCRVNWIKKGSGASLKALKAGEVDMVMVHAPAAEKKAVEEGWAVMRTLLGSNEFYIVGPKSDPAGIRRAKYVKDAYAMIAKAEARLFSRGDNSGTHKKEMMIWEMAGIEPKGDWYVVTKDFMGPTLMRADNEIGYFMTDSSTFIVKSAKIKNLRILFKGDPVLINVYHALAASPEKSPQAKYVLAEKFVRFMVSPEGQKIYKEFGKKKYGAALYQDAEYAKKLEK